MEFSWGHPHQWLPARDPPSLGNGVRSFLGVFHISGCPLLTCQAWAMVFGVFLGSTTSANRPNLRWFHTLSNSTMDYKYPKQGQWGTSQVQTTTEMIPFLPNCNRSTSTLLGETHRRHSGVCLLLSPVGSGLSLGICLVSFTAVLIKKNPPIPQRRKQLHVGRFYLSSQLEAQSTIARKSRQQGLA